MKSENRCPDCGKGTLAPVVASKTYTVDGKRVRVDGLIPLECNACKIRYWPELEVQRARRIINIKLGRAAA